MRRLEEPDYHNCLACKNIVRLALRWRRWADRYENRVHHSAQAKIAAKARATLLRHLADIVDKNCQYAKIKRARKV